MNEATTFQTKPTNSNLEKENYFTLISDNRPNYSMPNDFEIVVGNWNKNFVKL